MSNYTGYAAAYFGEGDAGANINEESFSACIHEIVNSQHVIKNLHQSLMNVIHDETITYDKKGSELKKAFVKYTGSMYVSKFTNLLKPLEEQENVNGILRILHGLSRDDFNPSARTHLDGLAIDLSGRILDVSGQIYDTSPIETKLHEITERYLQVLPELFETDRLLKESLDKFSFLEQKITMFLNFEHDETNADMFLTFSKYLLAQFENLDLKSRFNDFILRYREFVSLRKVIGFRANFEENYSSPGCGICLNDTVSYALIPCGHTFCQACTTKQRLHCFICRGGIESRLKLYFS